MMKRIGIIAAFMFMCTCSQSFGWDPRKDVEKFGDNFNRSDFGKLANTLKSPGAVIAEELIKGRPVDEAVKTAIEGERNKLNEAGRAIQSIDKAKTDAIRNVLGEDAAKVYETAKLGETIAKTTAIIVVNKAADIAVGKKTIEQAVREAINLPLDAAIQQAYDYYKDKSHELPFEVKRLLVAEFDPKLVQKARYADSNVDPNIASIINTLQTKIGTAVNGNHAVTVGNVIVFEKVPSEEDIWFWAHELTHAEQYEKWSISGFASRYIADYKSIEKEADNRANSLIEKLKIIQSFGANQASLK